MLKMDLDFSPARPENSEQLSKILALSALSIYSAGLVIAGAYYEFLGYPDFSLIRARYILVGSMWAFLVLLTIAISSKLTEAVAPFQPWKREALKLLAFLAVPLLFSFFGQGLGGSTLDVAGESFRSFLAAAFPTRQFSPRCAVYAEDFIDTAIATGSLLLSGIGLRRLYGHVLGSRFVWDGFSLPWHAIRSSIKSLICLALGVILYAIWLLPFIPESFGGGSLPLVVLHVKADRASSLRGAGLPLSGKNEFRSLELVSTEGDTYLVRPNNASVNSGVRLYRIPKDAVDLLTYSY
jgi:hypothetical protein